MVKKSVRRFNIGKLFMKKLFIEFCHIDNVITYSVMVVDSDFKGRYIHVILIKQFALCISNNTHR